MGKEACLYTIGGKPKYYVEVSNRAQFHMHLLFSLAPPLLGIHLKDRPAKNKTNKTHMCTKLLIVPQFEAKDWKQCKCPFVEN